MSKPTIITSTKMCGFLENLGFSCIRKKGSHRFYLHNDGRTALVPVHAKDLDRTIIRKILKDIDVSIDDYNKQI